jgi:uncharacterized protein YkwD
LASLSVERIYQGMEGIFVSRQCRMPKMNVELLCRRTFVARLGAVILVPAALVGETQRAQAASLQSEAALHLNACRAKAGVAPLAPDAHLASAAIAQCGIMIAHGKIGHAFGPGTGFSERMFRAGVAPGYHAENVARGQRSVAEVMQAWMNSSGHRRNMLDPQMSMFGIASKSGYWALDLAGPI